MLRFWLLAVSGWLITFSAAAQTTPCPCCGPEYRRFDFWLGEWNVYTGDTLAGTNRITLTQDSCLLREEWTSARSGYTGTSYNFYAAREKGWHQTWVDNQGGFLLLDGNFENGKMVLKSQPAPDRQGRMVINRVSWTPQENGTIRQHWEVSSDEGNSWRTVFDGRYKKE